MKRALLAGLVVSMSTICLLRQSDAQSATDKPEPSPAKIVFIKYQRVFDPVETAKRPKDMIRVIVSGQVGRPGVYYLPPTAKVHHAIESAGNLTDFSKWSRSCLLRPINADEAVKTEFRRETKPTDLEIPLKEGDRISINLGGY